MSVFSSKENTWMKIPLKMTATDGKEEMGPMPGIGILQGTAKKEFAGVTTIHSDGLVMVYYISPGGRLVAIDSQMSTASMFPDLYPEEDENALHLVECGGRIFIVSLIEEFESTMLIVWEYDAEEKKWRHFSCMPPDISEYYFGMEADVNCAACEDYVMVCVTSGIDQSFNQVVMYKISEDSWIELPSCSNVRGRGFKKFVVTYSFKPDIKVNV